MNYKGKRIKRLSAEEIKRWRQRVEGIIKGVAFIVLIASSGFAAGWWM